MNYKQTNTRRLTTKQKATKKVITRTCSNCQNKKQIQRGRGSKKPLCTECWKQKRQEQTKNQIKTHKTKTPHPNSKQYQQALLKAIKEVQL